MPLWWPIANNDHFRKKTKDLTHLGLCLATLREVSSLVFFFLFWKKLVLHQHATDGWRLGLKEQTTNQTKLCCF